MRNGEVVVAYVVDVAFNDGNADDDVSDDAATSAVVVLIVAF
jgi:hypothetical protein